MPFSRITWYFSIHDPGIKSLRKNYFYCFFISMGRIVLLLNFMDHRSEAKAVARSLFFNSTSDKTEK